MKQETTNSKQMLLEAALRVVIRDGFSALTVDAVAREAGLSKGGLFHHFPSKASLIQGFLGFFTQRAAEIIRKRMSEDMPNRPAKFIRAIMDVAFPDLVNAGENPEGKAFMSSHRDFMMGILTAGLLNRNLVCPLQSIHNQVCYDMLADQTTGMDQMILFMALDGLAMWSIIGLIEEDDPLRERMAMELRKRANELGD